MHLKLDVWQRGARSDMSRSGSEERFWDGYRKQSVWTPEVACELRYSIETEEEEPVEDLERMLCAGHVLDTPLPLQHYLP